MKHTTHPVYHDVRDLIIGAIALWLALMLLAMLFAPVAV